MHNTAMRRKRESAVVTEAYAGGAISGKVLDFGCGCGADVEWLAEEGFSVKGYDPNTPKFAKCPRGKFDTVLCTYVLNVLEDPKPVLEEAWAKVRKGGHLVVTVRGTSDVNYHAKKGCWLKRGKGWINSRGSYQRGYTLPELTRLCTGLPCDRMSMYSTKVNGNPMIVVVKL